MAILFQKQKNKSIYLIALIFVIVIAFFIWFILRRAPIQDLDNIIKDSVAQRQDDITIDFSKLENRLLEELEVFNPIIPMKEGYGRSNPFEPKTEE